MADSNTALPTAANLDLYGIHLFRIFLRYVPTNIDKIYNVYLLALCLGKN